MKHIFFLLLTLPCALEATTFGPVPAESSRNTPELEAILAELKPHGEFAAKTDPTQPEPVKVPPTMSAGQRAVEEAKARNRAALAERNANDKKEAETPKDTLADWKKQERATRGAWKEDTRDKLKGWQRERDIFLGRIKVYQENTFKLPVKEEKIVEKKITTDIPELTVVNGAFAVPVRDQKNRATCSAFAGLRAVEILLMQNKVERDLSEQYFYWASKPKCQSSPCEEKGSWVTPGYDFSKTQRMVDVPLEESCSYTESATPGNETQVPLPSGCKSGTVKVLAYEEVRTLADLVDRLKAHTPVILSTKLSENYYINKGLITLEDSTKSFGKVLNGHSLGHSYLAVGLMELPEKLKEKEGSFCVLVTNSWGKGWGAGGYSCVTQKWLEKFRTRNPFIAVTKVQTGG